MPKKETIFKEAEIKIKKAVFPLKELYQHMKDWFDDEGFDVTEKKYQEKIKPSGREIEIKWECTKEIDEYSMYVIKLTYKTIGINDIKIKQEGQDVKMQTGELSVKVTAELVLDYNEKWEQHPFVKLLQSFYEKYLYAGTITTMKNELWDKAWKCHKEIKSYLNLYKYEIK